MMKMMAGFALGMTIAAGCTPDQRSEQPASAKAEASAYWVAPTCGPTSVKSLRALLPNDKLIGAFEVDVQAMQRSPLFLDNKAVLEKEAKDVLDAMNACHLPLSKVERLVGGFGPGDDIVMGIKAKGVAEPKTLDCLAREIEKSTGKPAWSRTTTGCTTTLDMDGDDAKGFALGKDMVVIASKSLVEGVQRRIKGKGKGLLDGTLSWVRHEVDMGSTVWIAATVPPGAASSLGSSMKGVSHVGLGIDASRGLGMKVSAGFVSNADAMAARTELDTLTAQAGMMLPMLGLSSSVADTLVVDSKGATVSVSVFLNRSDVDALRAVMEGGGPGGSSPPSTPAPRRGM